MLSCCVLDYVTCLLASCVFNSCSCHLFCDSAMASSLSETSLLENLLTSKKSLKTP